MVQPYGLIVRQHLAIWTRSTAASKLTFRATGFIQSLKVHPGARVTLSTCNLWRHFHASTGSCQSKGIGNSSSILWRWLPGQTREALLRRTRRRDGASPSDELVYSSTTGSYAYWCQLVVYATSAPVVLLLGLDAYLSYTEHGQSIAAARAEASHSSNEHNPITFFIVDNSELLKSATLFVTLCVMVVARTMSRRIVWRIYYDARRDAFTAIFPGMVANRRMAFLPGEVLTNPDDVFWNHSIKGMKCIILPQAFKDNVHYNHMVGY